MKKTVTIISIICVIIIAAAVLFLTGTISVEARGKEENDSLPPLAYVLYMDAFVEIDRDGVALSMSPIRPEGMAEISGISFGHIVVGKKPVADDEKKLEYALSVAAELKNVGIDEIGEIFATSGGTIIMYMDNVKIDLGENRKTAEKIEDLKSFTHELKGLSGTLNMREADTNDMGYTFKKSK
ncbi:MAG: hypothetical protein ACOX75_06790 [Lachnospiraceae bacterium]|jgi:hypothetical protein